MGTETAVPSLDRLPVELWLACWALCSPRQLRRLSLVCRSFRTICFPLCIQLQTVDARVLRRGIERENWIERTQKLRRVAIRLEKLADKAALIRSWRFVARGIDFQPLAQVYPYIRHIGQFDSLCERAQTTFARTLGLCLNLRTLYVAHLHIDVAFQNVVSSLTMLEDLTLYDCTTLPWNGEPLRLKAFTIHGAPRPGPWDPDPLPLVAADTLCSLRINHSFQATAIIHGFDSAPLTHLVDLSLDDLVDVEATFLLLEQCPRVQSFEIAHISPAAAATLPPHLPPSTLAGLQNFTGPREVLRTFITNRPVRAVTVVGRRPGAGGGGGHPDMSSDDLLHALDDISHTSVPLHSLSLPRASLTPDGLRSIASRFPFLKELTLTLAQRHGGVLRTFPGPPDRTIDTREPVFADEYAFDGTPPEDDVSDCEEYSLDTIVSHAAGTPESGSNPLNNVLQWLSSRIVTLPTTLEILNVQLAGISPAYAAAIDPANKDMGISPGSAHWAIKALSRLYPLLRELQIGYFDGDVWTRSGDGRVWRKRGGSQDLYVRV